MIQTTRYGASFFRFNHLSKYSKINHGIFTRNNGFSDPPFNSLNVGAGSGEEQKKVSKNRQRIARCMGADELVCVHQVHGRDILVLTRDHEEESNCHSQVAFTADAMVTDIPGKFLLVQVADCQSVLMYDPTRKVVANVHCGWRGSIANIVGLTVHAMGAHFGSNPPQIQVGIGPSLGPCCAEFINYKTEIPEKFWAYKDSADHFDFWSITQDQLKAAGVLSANIECAKICTRCRTDLFFSYRGEGTTGRFGAVIGISSALQPAYPGWE